MKKYRLIISAILLAFSQTTLADCLLNGAWYEEGSIVGGYVCHEGEWKAAE